MEFNVLTNDNMRMDQRIRELDWSNTPLGPQHDWHPSMQSAIDLIIASPAQIISFWGPDCITIYNDSFAAIIGKQHPQALGIPAALGWPEQWQDVGPMVRHVQTTGSSYSAKDYSFFVQRFGFREEVTFDIACSAVRDQSGAVLGVFCIVHDTTEQINARLALRDNEAMLRAMFWQAGCGMVQTDARGNILMVNALYCSILGYSEEELLGKTIHEITHPDDLNSTTELFDESVSKDRHFQIEKRYVRKDGSLIWVNVSFGPLRMGAGKEPRSLAVIMDISESKRAAEVERRLASIIASSESGILSIDLNMVITSWNPGAERLYGYSATEAIGSSVAIILPDEHKFEEVTILDQIRQGITIPPYETSRRHKDGRMVDVSLSVSPIYDEYGQIIGASKIAHDITARRATERLQAVLMGEMKHRVKNVIAMVQAIARQTFTDSNDRLAAQQAFDARLKAMANTHDLLTREKWDRTELSILVAQALAPFEQHRFEINGPKSQMFPKAALTLSLALHELATNASKYGALSTEQGHVRLSWEIVGEQEPILELNWQEFDGPAVKVPKHRGFGSRLIERILAAELRGTAKLDYPVEGVICTIRAPLDADWNADDL